MTDDNADDDGYKALRSVWLSMPDEDPPDRGLSELMAAARVKAEEMSKPSLWQRIAATLRRPPVLALATLMVVLGGAALIGRHRDKLEASQTVSAPTPAREADQAIVAGSASSTGSAVTAAPEAPAPQPAQASAPAGAASAEPPPPPPREPMKHHAGTPHTTASTSVTGGDFADKAAVDKKSATSTKLDSNSQGSDAFAGPQAELAKDEEAPRVDPQAPVTQSPAALHKSARDAAARGDCDTEHRLVRKIAVADMHYYETNVVNDPKLAGCKKN